MREQLRVALVQTDLLWENPVENRRRFSERFKNFSQEVDLVILPEMFTTGFTMEPTKLESEEVEITLDWMKEQARKLNAAIVGSLVYKEGKEFFNRLFFVLPDQSFYTYDKKHTFTFAGENAKYSSGNNRLVVLYKGFRICPFICYDLRFPVWSRYKGDYDVLLYVANWPAPRIEAWDTLLKARAIENMSYTIGLNRVGEDPNGHSYIGHSAIYDPLGKQMVFSDREETIFSTLDLNSLKQIRDKFRFLDDRDEFNYC